MIYQPKIAILATGGTIAGASPDRLRLAGYKAGEFVAEALVAAVPQVNFIADIRIENIAQIDSKDMTSKIRETLRSRVQWVIDEGEVDGIVITHGTDTLEDTAYFLDLTVDAQCPVVLTAAMRPATAISADGPLNLIDAVRVAFDEKSRGLGVLATLGGIIYSGSDIRKRHTNSTNAFQAVKFPIGRLLDGVVAIDNHPTTRNENFRRLAPLTDSPRVDTIWLGADADDKLIQASLAAGAKGLVLATSGNGSLPASCRPAVYAAAADGIAVIVSSHVGAGYVFDDKENQYVGSGDLSPQKSRIFLQLALLKAKRENIKPNGDYLRSLLNG